jgi:hypothetical protein
MYVYDRARSSENGTLSLNPDDPRKVIRELLARAAKGSS